MPHDDLFRLYDPATDAFGKDGYPKAWHRDIKHVVRAQAGHRCVRCGHPYRNGEHGDGHWSPCDTACTHLGPVRMRESHRAGAWREHNLDTIGMGAGAAMLDTGPGGEIVKRWDIEAAWRILTVHHLNGDKADCRWWNLVALDQRCHLQIQGKVRMVRVWPWEHTDWFKPYVAGFYAHTYLNEDLTRGEVETRLDELLDLERIA